MVVVMPTMGAFGWMFGRSHKREKFPEYQSPNTWSKWMSKNNEALGLQDELIQTFNPKQMKLYKKYRESVLSAEREKPWQGEYAKANPLNKG